MGTACPPTPLEKAGLYVWQGLGFRGKAGDAATTFLLERSDRHSGIPLHMPNYRDHRPAFNLDGNWDSATSHDPPVATALHRTR